KNADYRAFLAKQEHIAEIGQLLGSILSAPTGPDGDRPSLTNLLKRTEVRIADLLPLFRDKLAFEPVRSELEAVEIAVKYEGYLIQQDRQIARLKRSETVRIPSAFEYAGIPG